MSGRLALLKILEYFPAIGFLTKFIIDAATSNSMTATSSIIQDSCIMLYLAYVCWMLISQSPSSSKFGIIVVASLIGVYATSIVMNANHMTLINGNEMDMMSDTFCVLSEIFILFMFMSAYILNQPSSVIWLIGLSLIALMHAIIVGFNYVKVNVEPTDDASQNIKPID
jgi:hypothetical protein